MAYDADEEWLSNLNKGVAQSAISPNTDEEWLANLNKGVSLSPENTDATNIVKGVGALGKGLLLLPEQLVAKAITAFGGQDMATVQEEAKGITGQFVDWTNRRAESLAREYENAGNFVPGISLRDVAQLVPNLAFSAVSMGGTLAGGAAGAAAGAAAGPAGIAAGGFAGSFAGGAIPGYRMDSYQAMQQLLEKKNQESVSKNGRPLNQQEEDAIKQDFSGFATKHGLWEAGPEAIGNIAEAAIWNIGPLKLLKSVAPKGLGGKAAKLLAQAAGTTATEMATETPTQMGQQRAEAEVGLAEEKPREWTNIEDWWKSAKEVFPQVLLLSAFMSGAGGIGTYAYNKHKENQIRALENPADPASDEFEKQKNARTVLAESAASIIEQKSPDLAEQFREYAEKQIETNQQIDMSLTTDPISLGTVLIEQENASALGLTNADIGLPSGTVAEPAEEVAITEQVPLAVPTVIEQAPPFAAAPVAAMPTVIEQAPPFAAAPVAAMPVVAEEAAPPLSKAEAMKEKMRVQDAARKAEALSKAAETPAPKKVSESTHQEFMDTGHPLQKSIRHLTYTDAIAVAPTEAKREKLYQESIAQYKAKGGTLEIAPMPQKEAKVVPAVPPEAEAVEKVSPKETLSSRMPQAARKEGEAPVIPQEEPKMQPAKSLKKGKTPKIPGEAFPGTLEASTIEKGVIEGGKGQKTETKTEGLLKPKAKRLVSSKKGAAVQGAVKPAKVVKEPSALAPKPKKTLNEIIVARAVAEREAREKETEEKRTKRRDEEAVKLRFERENPHKNPDSLYNEIRKSGHISKSKSETAGFTKIKGTFGPKLFKLFRANGMGVDEMAEEIIGRKIIEKNPGNVAPSDWLVQKLQEEQEGKAVTVKDLAKGEATTKKEEEFYEKKEAAEPTGEEFVSGAESEAAEKPKGVSFAKAKGATNTDTPEFKAWFKGSKVVDKKGKPRVVYHWTDYEFDAFDMGASGGLAHFGTKRAAWDRSRGLVNINYEIDSDEDEYWVYPDSGPNSGDGQGPFKTKTEAMNFIKTQPKKTAPLGVYLSIKNPLRVPDFGVWTMNAVREYLYNKNIITKQESDKIWESWQKSDNEGYMVFNKVLADQHYDGFVYTNEQEDSGSDSYVAILPTQIKSVYNQGTWSPENPNISMFRSDDFVSDVGPAAENDTPEHVAKVTGWVKGFLKATGFKNAKVNIIPSRLYIPSEFYDKGWLKEGDRVWGWWDADTDTVNIVAESIGSEAVAQKVVFEEFINHRGFEIVLDQMGRPQEKKLLYTLVYNEFKDQGKMATVVKDYEANIDTAEGRAMAGKEYMAHYMPDLINSPTLWSRIVAVVRNILRRLNFPVKYSQKDLETYLKTLVEKSVAFTRGQPVRGTGTGAQAFGKQGLAPTFYSKMAQVLEQKLPKTSDAKIMKSLVNSWVSKGEFKTEELKWSGLMDYLDGKEGKINKQEILDFVKMNQVEIQEVTKGEPTEEDIDVFLNDEAGEGFTREGAREYLKNDEGRTKFSQWQLPGGENYREILFTLPGLDYRSPHWGETNVLAHARINDRFSVGDMPSGMMETQGNKPASDSLAANAKTLSDLVESQTFISKGLSGLNIEDQKTVSTGVFRASRDPKILRGIIELIPIDMMNKLVGAKLSPQEFFSNQTMLTDSFTFNPNATVRLSGSTVSTFIRSIADLVTKEHGRSSKLVGLSVQGGQTPSTSDVVGLHKGKYTLFIEEIQSDLHQKGREEGYRRPYRPFDLRLGEEDDRQWVFEDPDQTYRFIGISKHEASNVDEARKQAVEYFNKNWDNPSNKAVPEAPFQKTWHEFVLKRLLRYAAENGYDSIAWTTGEQQADRYDLSKQLDRIEYEPIYAEDEAEQPTGQYEIAAFDKEGNEVLREDEVDIKRVEELVGKEVAQKIQSGEGRKLTDRPYRSWKTLEGLDLKVGGSGMKGFYDKMIPDFLNKYGKKWGARAGETTIGAGEYEVRLGEKGKWAIVQKSGDVVKDSDGSPMLFSTSKEADAYAETIADTTVHSFPITPSMKESVLYEGQPMFKKEAQALENQFMGKDDDFWGITYDEEGESQFTGLPYSGVQCTGYSARIRQMLGNKVKIYGFYEEDNPESAIAQSAGGHDFAVVDDRYIIDPWLMEVEGGRISTPNEEVTASKGVFDLADPKDAKEIERLYGDKSKWERMKNLEEEANKASTGLEPRTVSATSLEEIGDTTPSSRFNKPMFGKEDQTAQKRVDFLKSQAITTPGPVQGPGAYAKYMKAEPLNFIRSLGKDIGRILDPNGLIGEAFISPEFWQDTEQKEIVKAALNRTDNYHELMGKFDTVGEKGKEQKLSDVLKTLAQKGMSKADIIRGKASKEYQQYSDAINEADMNRTPEEEAIANLEAEGASKDTIEAYKLTREAYDNILSEKIKVLEDLHSTLKNNNPNFMTIERNDGTKEMFSLQETIDEMKALKGYYAPRIRTPGKWRVYATKMMPSETAPTDITKNVKREYLSFTNTHAEAEILKEKLRLEGWTPEAIKPQEYRPDKSYSALNVIEMTKFMEEAANAAGEQLGLNMEDDSVHLRFIEALVDELGTQIKSRGARKFDIHRKEGPATLGYLTDAAERFSRYKASTAAGMAKAQASREMMLAMFGFIDPQTGKRVGGISQKDQPKMWELSRKFIEEQLRNSDASDRAIARIKSIAALKYLTSPRNIFVNFLSMLTVVPGSLHAHAGKGKVPFTTIAKEMGRASRDYIQLMRGKKVGTVEEQKFVEDFSRKAWDLPQFTNDAQGSMQDAYSQAWSKVMQGAMWGFRTMEKWMRGVTLLAGYRIAKKSGEPVEVVWEQMAHEAMNRAHGIYDRASQPMLAQGTGLFNKIVKTFVGYMKFPHTYLQNLYDMGVRKKDLKAVAYNLMAPVLLGGASALLFKDILLFVPGLILKGLGVDDPEKWFWAAVRRNFGKEAETLGRLGLLGTAGIDLSSSLAVGVGVPTKISEFFGVGGGLYQDIKAAGEYASEGLYGRAAERILPTWPANLLKATREAEAGVTTGRGKRIFDEEGKAIIPTGMETVARALGFGGSRLGVVRQRTEEGIRIEKRYADKKNKIYEQFKDYVARPTAEKLQDIMDQIKEINKEILQNRLVPEVSLINGTTLRNQARMMIRPTKKEFARLRD